MFLAYFSTLVRKNSSDSLDSLESDFSGNPGLSITPAAAIIDAEEIESGNDSSKRLSNSRLVAPRKGKRRVLLANP